MSDPSSRPAAATRPAPGIPAFAISLIVVGALTLLAYRAGLWLHYRPDGSPGGAELARAFWMGLRFDLKWLATLAIPALLAGWALPQQSRGAALALYAGVLFVLINFLALVNHFYFGFFGSTIDPMIFGAIEDDTQIVIHTIRNDARLVPVLAAWFGFSALQGWLTLRLARRLPAAAAHPRWAYAAAVLLCAVLARGSLGTFALGSKHLSVSSDGFINQLVPNALQATYHTVKNRLESGISADPHAGLRGLGFRTPQQAAAALDLPPAANEDALIAQMYARTPKDPALERSPPHVVFAMMESMGRHLLEYDDPQANDLLGRLRRHLREDFTFRNFVSGQNGTHRTFESLLMNSPVTPLTQGRYGYHTYAGAAALPFKLAGYRTVFLTSGPSAWRNIADILRFQGFDEVHDQAHLRAAYPDAPFNLRGAPDEVAFRYARDLLDAADAAGTPLFVFVFTTNNHPPHLVPEGYRPLPLSLEPFAKRPPANADKAMRILGTYQYASDALGGFLDELKASALADRTVLVASGDHSTRDFFVYAGHNELPLAFGVPTYFYLPPARRAGLHYDPARFASHRDVFPTLYHHALSGACYLAVGSDLFAREPGSAFAPAPGAGMAIYDHVVTADGAVAKLSSEAPQFLRWTDASKVKLEPIEGEPPAALKSRAERERAYVALLDWQTRVQALEHRPAAPPCASVMPAEAGIQESSGFPLPRE
jgi:phosphoglycerol transferase MdoB-like AlkP superfamily enzyme